MRLPSVFFSPWMRFRVEHQNAVAASIQISERKGISRAEEKSRTTEKKTKKRKRQKTTTRKSFHPRRKPRSHLRIPGRNGPGANNGCPNSSPSSCLELSLFFPRRKCGRQKALPPARQTAFFSASCSSSSTARLRVLHPGTANHPAYLIRLVFPRASSSRDRAHAPTKRDEKKRKCRRRRLALCFCRHVTLWEEIH